MKNSKKISVIGMLRRGFSDLFGTSGFLPNSNVAREYRRVVTWFIRDAVRTNKLSLAAVFLMAGAAVLLQITGTMLAIRYVSGLERGNGFVVLGQRFGVDGSAWLLAAVAVSVMSLYATSAILSYAARRTTVAMMTRYQRRCGLRVLRRFSDTYTVRPKFWKLMPSRKSLIQLLTKDAGFCARALMEIANSIVPAFVFIVISVYVFWIDPNFSLSIFAVMGVFTILQVRVGRRAAAVALDFEQKSIADASSTVSIVDRLARLSLSPSIVEITLRGYTENADAHSYDRVFEQRLSTASLGLLVAGLQVALLIFMVILYLGGKAFAGVATVSSTLIYMVLLIYLFISFRVLSKSITNINSYYPHMRRLIFYLSQDESGGNARSDPDGGMRKVGRAEARGVVHAVVLDCYLDRFSLPVVLRTLFPILRNYVDSLDSVSVGLADPWYPADPLSIWRTAGFVEPMTREQLLERYPFTEPVDELLAMAALDESPVDAWTRASAATRFVYSALQVISMSPEIVFLSANGMSWLPKDQRAFIQESLVEKVVIIWADRMPQLLADFVRADQEVLIADTTTRKFRRRMLAEALDEYASPNAAKTNAVESLDRLTSSDLGES